MMYNQKLVASIKANRKILREFKDTVYVPFSSEYSILLKNLNTVRAVVHVYIDGEDQTPSGLVINADQEIDFERSLKNGSLTEGNKFKFIERTGAVEAHRGIKLEDGIVRVEYQFEKPAVSVSQLPWMDNHILRGISNGSITPSGSTGTAYPGATASATYCSTTSASLNATNISAQSFNDAGITVAGSKSTQSFSTTYVGALENEKHTIVLKLLGETPDNKPVVKPVTVKHKPKCTTCGKQNKAHAKFCTECGTALEIFA